MKLDLCKLFDVEEGEEFKLLDNGIEYDYLYKIIDNHLCAKLITKDNQREWYEETDLHINTLALPEVEVVKLPKKKQFTDDELCILRNINKKYKWITRDKSDNLCIFEEKPYKENEDEIWDNKHNDYIEFHCYNHLFNSIKWEDNEPIYIDNYVDRC